MKENNERQISYIRTHPFSFAIGVIYSIFWFAGLGYGLSEAKVITDLAELQFYAIVYLLILALVLEVRQRRQAYHLELLLRAYLEHNKVDAEDLINAQDCAGGSENESCPVKNQAELKRQIITIIAFVGIGVLLFALLLVSLL